MTIISPYLRGATKTGYIRQSKIDASIFGLIEHDLGLLRDTRAQNRNEVQTLAIHGL